MPFPSDDDALYDEAFGPRNPRSLRARQKPMNGVWDDPTWICAAVDEEYMAREDRLAMRYGFRLPGTKEWIGLKEASRLLGSNYQAVYRRMVDGRLPFDARYDFGWKVHRAQVEAYLKGVPLPDVLGEKADHDLEEGGAGPGRDGDGV